jgi:hypothetical protein
MNRVFLSVLGVVSSIFAAGALLGACSSTTSTGSGASDTSFCSAYANYFNGCDAGQGSACAQAELALATSDCSALAATFSVAFKNAVTSCAPAPNCPYGDPFLSTCFASAASVLTPAQTKLANDYCGSCATAYDQTTTQCTETFWGLNSDAGGPGPGAIELQYSDAIVESIDKCTSALDGSPDDCFEFTGCAANAVAAMLPPTPSACMYDAGTAGDGG